MTAAAPQLADFVVHLDHALLADSHLSGTVRITSTTSPILALEISAFWFAAHQGLADMKVVSRTALEPVPALNTDARFTLPFPKGPPTYAGELLTIDWFVRVSVITDAGVAAADIGFRVHSQATPRPAASPSPGSVSTLSQRPS